VQDHAERQIYSIEAVARMQRCPVDPETFLRVRPQASIKTVNGLNRRLRAGFPGAFKIPGDRQWSIDLVTYDQEVNKMLNSSVEQAKAESRSALPDNLLNMVNNDSVVEKVLRKLAANG
jgi:hypothetical protein